MQNNQLSPKKVSDWKLMSFNQVISQILDFRGKTPLKLGMNWGGSIPALSANNVKKGYIDFESECHMASEELYSKWMNKGDLKKGDIVFTMEAPLGNVAIVPDDRKYILSQRVVAFRFSKEVCNLMMYHYLLSDIFQERLKLLGTGSTAKGINQRSLTKIKFLLPPLPEQNRIVSVLETWDQSIDKLSKKIQIKKQIKKSLMHELLTGKKRLKGFSDKLKFVKLEKIGTFKGGNGFPEIYQGDKNGDLPFFKVSDMNIIGNEMKMISSNNWIGQDKKNLIKPTVFPVNTIVIAKIGAAIFLERKRMLVQESCLDNNMMGFIVNNENINFIYYKFLSINFSGYANITALPSLSGGDLSEIEIWLPDIKEQTAIANILTTADNELTLLNKKLTLLKSQKKFLLNNLITGKIRTPENLTIKK